MLHRHTINKHSKNGCSSVAENYCVSLKRCWKLPNVWFICLFVWLVGFLTSSLTSRIYRERAPRESVWQFYVLPHMRQSWGTMTSASAGHIILTPTQPVGSGRPQPGSNRNLLTKSRGLYRLSYCARRLMWEDHLILPGYSKSSKRIALKKLLTWWV